MEDEPIKYKRFMVFSGYDYESRGGTKDYFSSFDTKEEAAEAVANLNVKYQWYEVFDRIEGVTVLTS